MAESQAAPPGHAGGGNVDLEKLRGIAVSQRMLMFCILGYVAAVVLSFVLPAAITWLAGILGFVAVVAAVVSVFMLGIKVYSTGVGIVLGILTFVPLVGLIVMLVLNGKATSILKARGIKVGLMGANPSTVV